MADYNHLRSRANDTLQSALVSVPVGDGGGGDGLHDGGVEVPHRRLWQVQLLQLPQEEHHRLSWVLMVSRKRKDSHMVMGSGGGWVGLGSS